jgi:GDPmannose 4,6-dehydratase
VSILITGVTGQDGSYLAEQFCAAGEQVIGLVHPHDTLPAPLVALQARTGLTLAPCELADPAQFRHALKALEPKRVFHLAAQSQPLACERDPLGSRNVNVVSCEVLVEWLRREQHGGRVLLVASAAVFGSRAAAPQSEATPSQPDSEYGRQKQAVRELAAAARQDGMFVACALPFNHESERRSEDFVFAKVCNSVARIALGQQLGLRLGALAPRRDWGYAPEYTLAMAWMLDVAAPLELVLGTGESHSVEDLARLACAAADVDYAGAVASDLAVAAEHDPGIPELCANPALAWKELGWEAQTKFAGLVERLVGAALERLKR